MEHCLKNVLIPGVSDYSRARVGQKESFTIFFPADLWKTGLYDYVQRPKWPSKIQTGPHELQCTLSEIVNNQKKKK